MVAADSEKPVSDYGWRGSDGGENGMRVTYYGEFAVALRL